jgi:hypothetical protein
MHFPKLGCGMAAALGIFSLMGASCAGQSPKAEGDMRAEPQIAAALQTVSAQRIQQGTGRLEFAISPQAAHPVWPNE